MLVLIAFFDKDTLTGTQHASTMTEARTLLLLRDLLPADSEGHIWEHKYGEISAKLYPLSDGMWNEFERQGEVNAPS